MGARRTTNDSRLLKITRLYQERSEGEIFANKSLYLGYFGGTPLVNIRDITFPQHCRLQLTRKIQRLIKKGTPIKRTMQYSSSKRKQLRNAQREMEDPSQERRM